MLRGLADRRLAVFILPKDEPAQQRAEVVVKALEVAGARLHVLSGAGFTDSDFASGRFAALVLLGDNVSGAVASPDPRVVQLTREFLASEKPVAAWGAALQIILESSGAKGRLVAGDAALKAAAEQAGATFIDAPMHVDDELITASSSVGAEEFAARAVKELSNRLEERALDEMSELSFPASDPPAVSPSSIGSGGREREGDTGT